MRRSKALSVAAVCGMVGIGRAEFVPGHIFVADAAGKLCAGPPNAWDKIWQIDPETGQVSLFAELADEWCGLVTGMVFTPDGTRLRVAQYLRHRILEFDTLGNRSILYDSSDGIVAPLPNSITYDRQGNFYVASGGAILRFAPGSDVAEIYADRVSDPLLDRNSGPLTIDIRGDLYFGNHRGSQNHILLFQGPHNESIFEALPFNVDAISMASDSCGNVYVGTDAELDPAVIYRYAKGDPSSKTLVNQETVGSFPTMALDPTENFLYVTTTSRRISKLNLSDGSLSTVAEIPDAMSARDGIAVVPVQNPPYGLTPCPPPIPALSAWGMLILAILIIIVAKISYRKHSAFD